MGRQQYAEQDHANHPIFSQQAQLPKAKPFNYLNPNMKIGVSPMNQIKPVAAAQVTQTPKGLEISKKTSAELRAKGHSPKGKKISPA